MDGSGNEDGGARAADQAGGHAADSAAFDGHVQEYDLEVTLDN